MSDIDWVRECPELATEEGLRAKGLWPLEKETPSPCRRLDHPTPYVQALMTQLQNMNDAQRQTQQLPPKTTCEHRRWQLIVGPRRTTRSGECPEGYPIAVCCGCLAQVKVTEGWLTREEKRWGAES